MKTESHSINDVLAKNATSFFIPPFQRAYAWGRGEIERYFKDVLRIIESEMNVEEHDKWEHFFGTIVIKDERDGFANRSVVVDGQQRLTTTLLLLIALRDLEEDERNRGFIDDNYLKNNSSTFQDKIKLKQVTKDWDAYRALVNGEENVSSGVVFSAYSYFKKLIADTRRINPDIRLAHYITAIQRMNVAVIFLDERPFKGEDPQIIFETLNSLGKPLTLSDLVRNFVLLNMKSGEQSQVYEEVWHPEIESVLGDKTSEFFRDYLQCKLSVSLKAVSDNNTKELYQIFKDFVGRYFDSHNDFINDIVKFVPWYESIVEINSSVRLCDDVRKEVEIKELLRNIFHDITSEAFKPFVLGLLEAHHSATKGCGIDDDSLILVLSAIRTFLIRRRVCGLAQGENKNVVLLSKFIPSLVDGSISIWDLLSGMFFSVRLPNDMEVKNSLMAANFYMGLKKYAKFILGKIEEYNSKVAVDFRDAKVTIEHIMPQTLTGDWERELGDGFKEIYDGFLHNIGNLILTEFNSEMGNKSFGDKKMRLTSSNLNYRCFVLERDVWDEISISEHQAMMISGFLGTFSLPQAYRDKQNWKVKYLVPMNFSPLDVEAGEAVTGMIPSEFRIFNGLFKVSSWQDLFLKFLNFIRDSEDYDFDYLFKNQNDVFGNDGAIVTWKWLSKKILVSKSSVGAYKSFEGKYCNRMKDVRDGEMFIYINLTATQIVERVREIMECFGMGEESVEVGIREKVGIIVGVDEVVKRNIR